MAMIHTEVKHGEMKRTPQARDAVNDEWIKLIDMGAFGMNAFEPMDKVKEQYDKARKLVHFGNLIAICHEKHSELPKEDRKYKGRVVFRGDTVKDIDGYCAVFSEQGTSSSHMAATKFIDAIALMPGRAWHGRCRVRHNECLHSSGTQECLEFPWQGLPIRGHMGYTASLPGARQISTYGNACISALQKAVWT